MARQKTVVTHQGVLYIYVMVAQSEVVQGKEIEAIWADESESRLDAFQAGKLAARSFDDVMKEMNV